MNNFTKEELEDLYTAIRHCYKQHIDLPSDTDIERFSYDLMHKIQSMIETYCDHHDYSEAELFVDVCTECGAVLIRD